MAAGEYVSVSSQRELYEQQIAVERQERVGGLQRGRPGVADVHHVRRLAGGDRGLDPGLQVRPADHFEVDRGGAAAHIDKV